MSRWRMMVTVPVAAACSRRFILKSLQPRKGLFSPPTPAFGSHCPSFSPRACVAPSHSGYEWHSDLPTVWILHVLAAGGLVPSIYFYIYVLSLQLTASSPGREGRVCGRAQASCGDHLDSHCGKCKDCCSRSLLRGSIRERESRELLSLRLSTQAQLYCN